MVFNIPTLVSEQEFLEIKRGGIIDSKTPKFWSFQFINIACIFLLPLLLVFLPHEWVIGLLGYILTKIVFETYYYNQYTSRRQRYLKELISITIRSNDYIEFYNEYHKCFFKSKIGKIINLVNIRDNEPSNSDYVNNVDYVYTEAIRMLESKTSTANDVKDWLQKRGFNEERAEIITNKIVEKLQKRNRRKKYLNIFYGMVLILFGLFCCYFLPDKNFHILLIIIGGVIFIKALLS
jgi:hypothetical protein